MRINKQLLLFEILLAILTALYWFFEKEPALAPIGIIFLLLAYLQIRIGWMARRINRIVVEVAILIAIPIYIFFFDKLISISVNHNMYYLVMLWGYFSLVAFNLALYISAFLLIELVESFKTNRERWFKSLALSLSFPLWECFVVPSFTMLANSANYSGKYSDYAIVWGITSLVVTILIQSLICKACEESLWWVKPLVLSLLLSTYSQYMFLNKDINKLNGANVFEWSDHSIYSVVDLIIWLLIAAICLYLSRRKRELFEKAAFVVPLCLVTIWIVTLLTQIFTAPKAAFERAEFAEDASEQYIVARNKNVIVFVFDALDNIFISELYEEAPEYFDDFEDFTLYTNTCSVYDVTDMSLAQMFSGQTIEGGGSDYEEFYNRLHNNGYVIDFYSYDARYSMPSLEKYIDNYRMVRRDDKVIINYQYILKNSLNLVLYQTAPDVLKGIVNLKNITFTDSVTFNSSDRQKAIYDNTEFLDNLTLSINDDYENALIMQHLYGAHETCDFRAETINCLKIANKYIEELKRLNLYEEATIILTADHGMHDDMSIEYPTASTPMFMMHTAGESHDKMHISDAPEYHTDILPTIMATQDMYDENSDIEILGKPLYMYENVESRRRVWANRDYDDWNKLLLFEYYMDFDELSQKVKRNEYYKIVRVE